MLSLQTNAASLTAQQNLARTNNSLRISFERLSTGLRINEMAQLPVSPAKAGNSAEAAASQVIAKAQTEDANLSNTQLVLKKSLRWYNRLATAQQPLPTAMQSTRNSPAWKASLRLFLLAPTTTHCPNPM
ncbi:hypothetical protein [Agrobacterium sp. Azo12]|uniref:hypothetical protein n=1 Tax=Agrobacterium sp. Azo12 TaxID=3031129 RepID=UPI0023D7FF6A|nr:hypothetical protein [Agrobacterium sp. Azo12]MDO5897174.1 hypothetical protein [Agrobacterium sp. Azo12]